MNTLKTIIGDAASNNGAVWACRITLAAETLTALKDATNPHSGVVKKITVNLTAGNEACDFVSGDDVTDGSADGLFVAAYGRPGLFAQETTGFYDNNTDFTYDLTPAPVQDAGGVELTLSAYRGMRGTTIGDMLDSARQATHASWRWDGTGDLAFWPFGAPEGSYENWPTIAAGSSGLWHVDTLRTLIVRNRGASDGNLHLLLLQEEGRVP